MIFSCFFLIFLIFSTLVADFFEFLQCLLILKYLICGLCVFAFPPQDTPLAPAHPPPQDPSPRHPASETPPPETLRWTAQNFALFFPSPATIFILSSSLGGRLVEFWWCLKRRDLGLS